MGSVMDKSFRTLDGFFTENHVIPVGPPLSIYRDWDGNTMAVEVGFPVGPDELAKASGNVLAGKSPDASALRLLHNGAYSGLNAVCRRLGQAMKEASLSPSGLTWEVYLSGPGTTEEANFETEIFMQTTQPSA